ncbi:hypothetical protein KEM52_005786 [Ascosphaera acerosa]|nr:hypothetical protein KEM52_005786 [Ascosphaera acerosa]
MLINEKTAISSSRVLLVPYEKHHVARYHEWMQDPEIQEATASEPLSVEEEYAMQASWRQDADKLTFIICRPLPPASAPALALSSSTSRQTPSSGQQIEATTPRELKGPMPAVHCDTGSCDAEENMLGDVNIFVTFLDDEEEEDAEKEAEGQGAEAHTNCSGDDDRPRSTGTGTGKPRPVVGELELMIAERKNQQSGYGRAALLCFLTYVLRHQDTIIRAFLADQARRRPHGHGPVPGYDDGGGRPDPDPDADADAAHDQGLHFAHLCVKIGGSNAGSIRLFESLGFRKVTDLPNVFGELELRRTFGPAAGVAEARRLMQRYGVQGYAELPYRSL